MLLSCHFSITNLIHFLLTYHRHDNLHASFPPRASYTHLCKDMPIITSNSTHPSPGAGDGQEPEERGAEEGADAGV